MQKCTHKGNDFCVTLQFKKKMNYKNKSKEELVSLNQQLEAINRQLLAANQQLKANDGTLKMTNNALIERVKELNCLYKISNVVEKKCVTLDEIFQETCNIMPPAWQYSDITNVRIVYENAEYKSSNFNKTKWKQSADIKFHGKKVGVVEVYYSKKMPQLDEGPFLKEERNLLNAVAERVGRIIERMHTEQALRSSEEKYRTLVDNANEAIIVMQDEIFKFVNPQTVNLTGYSEEDLISVPFLRFIHPDDQKSVMDKYFMIIKGKKRPSIIQYKIINKDGNIKWVSGNSILVIWNQKPAVLSLLTDITVQKKLREQLIQSEKLSAAGQLASGMAHEFNNILTVIKNKARLSFLEIKNKSKILDNIKVIDDYSDKAANIIKNINSFAKPNPSHLRIEDITRVIQSVIKIIEKQFKLENIYIKKNFQTQAKVKVDSWQFEQVFLNIFINARHAIKPKGKGIISVSVKNIKNKVEISICDNGIGIEKGIQKDIFTPFFTTKGAMAKNNLGIDGTGLGLSIVHTIIEKHNGTINVESQEGKGTTFTISLPAVLDKENAGV